MICWTFCVLSAMMRRLLLRLFWRRWILRITRYIHLLFWRKLVKLLPALQIHNSDEIYYHIVCKFSWITFGNDEAMCTSGCSLVKPRYSWELDKWQNLMQRGLRCWVMLQRRFNGRFGHSLQEGIWLPCEKLLSRFRNIGEVWILCSTPYHLDRNFVDDECSCIMGTLCLNFLVSPSTGRLARKRYQKMRQEAAAICIQKNVRMWLARKKYIETKEAAIKIQSGYRGMAARKEHRFRRQTKAVIIMQVIEQYSLKSLTLVLALFENVLWLAFNFRMGYPVVRS